MRCPAQHNRIVLISSQVIQIKNESVPECIEGCSKEKEEKNRRTNKELRDAESSGIGGKAKHHNFWMVYWGLLFIEHLQEGETTNRNKHHRKCWCWCRWCSLFAKAMKERRGEKGWWGGGVCYAYLVSWWRQRKMHNAITWIAKCITATSWAIIINSTARHSKLCGFFGDVNFKEEGGGGGGVAWNGSEEKNRTR